MTLDQSKQRWYKSLYWLLSRYEIVVLLFISNV